MIPNLREAAEHSDMTEELAEILSTNKVDVRYKVKTGIESNAIGTTTLPAGGGERNQIGLL